MIRIYFLIFLTNSLNSDFNLIFRSFYKIRLHQYVFIGTKEIQFDAIYSDNDHENLYSYIIRKFVNQKIIKCSFFFKIQSPLFSDLNIHFRMKKTDSFILLFSQSLLRYQYYIISLIDHFSDKY
jgi:hypothetical protein